LQAATGLSRNCEIALEAELPPPPHVEFEHTHTTDHPELVTTATTSTSTAASGGFDSWRSEDWTVTKSAGDAPPSELLVNPEQHAEITCSPICSTGTLIGPSHLRSRESDLTPIPSMMSSLNQDIAIPFRPYGYSSGISYRDWIDIQTNVTRNPSRVIDTPLGLSGIPNSPLIGSSWVTNMQAWESWTSSDRLTSAVNNETITAAPTYTLVATGSASPLTIQACCGGGFQLDSNSQASWLILVFPALITIVSLCVVPIVVFLHFAQDRRRTKRINITRDRITSTEAKFRTGSKWESKPEVLDNGLRKRLARKPEF
jgi:hypothetical protein